jgi:hypothetical protein
MPVPAVIVPVCTMGMAREGSCRLEQMLPKKGGRNGASSLERWSGREVANCDSCAAEEMVTDRNSKVLVQQTVVGMVRFSQLVLALTAQALTVGSAVAVAAAGGRRLPCLGGGNVGTNGEVSNGSSIRAHGGDLSLLGPSQL